MWFSERPAFTSGSEWGETPVRRKGGRLPVLSSIRGRWTNILVAHGAFLYITPFSYSTRYLTTEGGDVFGQWLCSVTRQLVAYRRADAADPTCDVRTFGGLICPPRRPTSPDK